MPNSIGTGLRASIWLATFLTPTAFVLLVMLLDRWHVPGPPEGLVVGLFILIPILAMLACAAAVWFSKTSLSWRMGGLALTVLAMLLQCGVLLAVIISAVGAAIAPVQ